MGMVRVFEWPDGTLAVMEPGSGVTLDEAQQRAMAVDPAGLPWGSFRNMLHTDLPPKKEVDADGDQEPVRAAWRMSGNQVVVDQTKIPPNWAGLRFRLMAEYSAEDAIITRIGAFDAAMITQDVQQARSVIGEMRRALDPQDRARFNEIVHTKKF